MVYLPADVCASPIALRKKVVNLFMFGPGVLWLFRGQSNAVGGNGW